MSSHVPGFQSSFRFIHHFVVAKLATSSIRVKVIPIYHVTEFLLAITTINVRAAHIDYIAKVNGSTNQISLITFVSSTRSDVTAGTRFLLQAVQLSVPLQLSADPRWPTSDPWLPAYRGDRQQCLLNPYNAEATFIKGQGRKYVLKPSKPCHVGIHWIALTEYSRMSTHMPGFHTFSGFLHHFIMAKFATSSIRVKAYYKAVRGKSSSLHTTG